MATIITERPVTDVVVGVLGPQGPKGPAGADGVDGGAAFAYTHTQAAPATTWAIHHNLGKPPAVTTVLASGQEVVGSLTHADANNATVEFTYPIAGTAYCS